LNAPNNYIITDGGQEAPFEFTVKTDNAGVSTSTEFRMPLTTSTDLGFTVNWGDGSPLETITDHTLAIHDYGTAGTYTISVTGSLLGWRFNSGGDKLKMLNVSQWAGLNISIGAGFFGCTNLTANATDAPLITSTNLSFYFYACTNFNVDIGSWDVSKVIDFGSMFYLSGFNNGGSNNIDNWTFSTTSNISMPSMLRQCPFNQPIGSWNVSKVTNMTAMFRSTPFNQDISNWDIKQVSNFTAFMTNATLSTINYDLLLVDWEANLQGLYPNGAGYPYTIGITFGGSKYTLGSAAATARQSLIDNFNWSITDSGGI
jgi:surface protein